MHLNPSQSRTAAVVILILCGAASVCAQTVTFSGRVTDQNTGQGIAGVAVVAEGNQTGTRVAVSDAQGNLSQDAACIRSPGRVLIRHA